MEWYKFSLGRRSTQMQSWHGSNLAFDTKNTVTCKERLQPEVSQHGEQRRPLALALRPMMLPLWLLANMPLGSCLCDTNSSPHPPFVALESCRWSGNQRSKSRRAQGDVARGVDGWMQAAIDPVAFRVVLVC